MPILTRKGITPEATASNAEITWKQPQRCIWKKNRNLTVQARVYAKVMKSTQALMLAEGKTLFSICVCCADMCKIFNTV